MRKFISKISFFSVPFLLFYLLNTFFYNQNEGGLTRVGYLYNNPSPKSKVSKQFSLRKQYTLVSELNLNTKTKFDVLTIGDSFSEQDSLGYKNFLANKGVSVLHMDRFLSDNPIQKLIELLNGDFFDSAQTDYVVLQSVERNFVQRCQNVDYTKSLQLDSIKSKISKHKYIIPERQLDFFSDATLKIPLTNIQYFFNSKPKYSKTYKVATNTDNLFSGNPNNLLFYQNDIDNMQYKNDSLKIAKSNQVLNNINNLLSEKNIQLIVLISPDKYDLYYPYIKNNQNFETPLFFTYYNSLEKDYKYLNTLKILSKEIKAQKDIYYYDDTHWSPIAANIIAGEIKKTMKANSINIP